METPSGRPIKSYAEMRAENEAGGVSPGIACPRCGCTATMVTHTKRMFGRVKRYRQCVHPLCKCRFVTEEKEPHRVDKA